MSVALTRTACAVSEAALTLSSGVDVRLAAAVGITTPRDVVVGRQAFVLVPTLVNPHGVELDEGMRWRRVPALDLLQAAADNGFESFDLTKLVARRLAYVADDAAELTFAVRKAA